jgi:arylsulfatase A-like enzyme
MENLTAGDVARLHRPGAAPCGQSEIPYPHFLETWQTSRFLQRLARRPEGRPFFAVCSFNAPHFPMIVPAPYDRLIDPARVPLPAGLQEGPGAKPAEVAGSGYARHAADLDEGEWRRLIAHYWGLCSLVDAQVGRMVAYLEREGLLDTTLVVYTADHGDMMGTHGLLEKGYPLHYEPALRVPLVIARPGAAGGTRPEGMLTLMDVLPTVAALTGVDLPEGHGGISAAGAVGGDAAAPLRPYAVAESFTFDGTEGGDGEYTSLDDFEARRGTVNISLRTPEARYVWRWDGTEELYDHTTDPDERHDLAAEPARAGQRAALRETLLGDVAGSAPLLAQLVRRRLASGAGARP